MSIRGLAYVALAVREAGPVADALERRFGLPRREARAPHGGSVPVLGVGASALAVFALDDPFLGGAARPGVHHVAMAAEEPEGVAADIAADAAMVPGLDGTREVRLDGAGTGGVALRICEPLAGVAGGGGMVERIDHVGVASADNAAATAFFAGRLGLAVESTQTDLEVHTATESFTSDRYGVVYRHRPPRIVGGLRVTFVTVGDCELEFLEPFAPEGGDAAGDAPGRGPGNTGGDKNAIGRYIQRHGPGLHHLALKTPDIDAALADLRDAGLDVIDAEGRPGSRRARIGFVHPRSLGGVLLHLVERDEL